MVQGKFDNAIEALGKAFGKLVRIAFWAKWKECKTGNFSNIKILTLKAHCCCQ
jgi:hypothetical protein